MAYNAGGVFSQILRGGASVVAARQPAQSGKLGVDATRKWKEEGYPHEWPEECTMTDEVRQRVDELWANLGL